MRKLYSIPLIFFGIAAGIGLFLRWQFISPTPGIRYAWFVHGHSHIMFLGWVFNVLYLAFSEYHLSERSRPRFLKFFIFLQLLVAAMMISFPLQGYGVFSIVLSTLHTLAILVFIPVYLIKTADSNLTSTWFSRLAWIFFFISTAGPFSLGYLMANGMGNTIWYNLSIYYYLHFQYNGFFLFGVFSLFFQLLERHAISFSQVRARKFGFWTAVACVPAYLLSTLYVKPGLWFNVIGAASALLQLYAFYFFARELKSLWRQMQSKFAKTANALFVTALLGLILKLGLQAISAHPDIAGVVYSLRPVVIAYLHLVLLGIISAVLLAWYISRQLVDYRYATVSCWMLGAGFLGTEIGLVCQPWWSQLTGGSVSAPETLFAFSIVLFLGVITFCIAFLIRRSPTQPAPTIPKGFNINSPGGNPVDESNRVQPRRG